MVLFSSRQPKQGRPSSLSCRDKGRMRGRVGALCLSWWQTIPLEFHDASDQAPPRTSTRPPHPPNPSPCPYRKRRSTPIPLFGRQTSSGRLGRKRPYHFPIWLSKCIRTGTTPSTSIVVLIGKVQQDARNASVP